MAEGILIDEEISFHSINIPSEWGLKHRKQIMGIFNSVSIQLISPASGDSSHLQGSLEMFCFHSINIPSEWGLQELNKKVPDNCFHSINIPSEWGRNLAERLENFNLSFHSINIPSEWGQKVYSNKVLE